jgi:hypothetical protein
MESSRAVSNRQAAPIAGFRRQILIMLIVCVIVSFTSVFVSQKGIVQFKSGAYDILYDGGEDIVTDAHVIDVEGEYKAAIRKNTKNEASDENESENESNQDDELQNAKDEATDDGLQNDKEKVSTDDTERSDINTNEFTHNGQKMNVVVLFPDDWRHDSIGAENPIIKTPFLDTLAQEGMRFRQNAVTTSICWQSRATLFTGQWASRHQAFKLKCPHFAKGKNWNHTWPALLQQKAGYHVAHVGKWQYHSDQKGRFDWSSYFEGKHVFRKQGKDIAAEDFAKNETIRFLNERPKDKPFAVTVAFYPPKPVSNSQVPVSSMHTEEK